MDFEVVLLWLSPQREQRRKFDTAIKAIVQVINARRTKLAMQIFFTKTFNARKHNSNINFSVGLYLILPPCMRRERAGAEICYMRAKPLISEKSYGEKEIASESAIYILLYFFFFQIYIFCFRCTLRLYVLEWFGACLPTRA